jgi:hypothetical protein
MVMTTAKDRRKEVKNMEDAQEVKEILDVVADKVPKLLNDITEALFNVDKAEQFGVAVAKFHKSMIEAGMTPEQAFELTQKFMDSYSPGAMISKAIGGMGGGGGHNINIGGHGHDDLGDEIEKKVKAKIARKLDEDE